MIMGPTACSSLYPLSQFFSFFNLYVTILSLNFDLIQVSLLEIYAIIGRQGFHEFLCLSIFEELLKIFFLHILKINIDTLLRIQVRMKEFG